MEPQLVATFLGIGKAPDVQQLLVVGPVAPLDEAVLPGRTRRAGPVQQLSSRHQPLERGSAFGMGRVAHGELRRVVRPDPPERGQPILGAAQHPGDRPRAMVRMDLRVFQARPEMDEADFIREAGAARDGGQLLDIHLHPVPPHGNRLALATPPWRTGLLPLGDPQDVPDMVPVIYE